MKFWKSDADCVRDYLDLKEMSWGQKLAVSSFAIGPILVTIPIIRGCSNCWNAYTLVCWRIVLVAWWPALAAELTKYTRGYLAERRGCEPSINELGSIPQVTKGIVITFAILATILLSMTVLLHRKDLFAPFMMVGLFFFNLSSYTSARFRASHPRTAA